MVAEFNLGESVDQQEMAETEQVNGIGPDNDSTFAVPTTASLEALQSAEQRDLMDLVDRLRRTGLNSVLQLPQIVVCGDQSSGKSSVLEAITDIPFPRRENLCTRFATAIVLKRDTESTISCKINPDDERPRDEQEKLREFSKSITDFSELPSLVDEATELMGLGPLKAFSRDVLSIEICGPNRPQLTLVDLPGLIHSSNKSQSEGDVTLIKSLVESYISESRTIILAVVSAKNDYANQVILKHCREFDPDGSRTIGVITKPDDLTPGSENEALWLDLVQNRDVYFELGWHVLKNRADNEHHLSLAERNLKERSFLNAGNYKSLPQNIKGVDALRARLSDLLFNHLKRELPTLRNELDKMYTETCAELTGLGQSRSNLLDQKIYLTELFSSACHILTMGVDGNYENAFFGSADLEAAVDGKENARRFRAVIQHMNIQFSKHMCQKGQTYLIQNETEAEYIATALPSKKKKGKDVKKSGVETEDCDPTSPPKQKKVIEVEEPWKATSQMTRKQAIEWVTRIFQRNRGRELPGTFNPMLINQLFRIQSQYWEHFARSHIDSIAEACKQFVFDILDYVTNLEIKSRLLKLTVSPALKLAHEAAVKELGNIINDQKRHPITYNHYFTDTLQKIQHDRQSNQIKKVTREATACPDLRHEEKDYIDLSLFHQRLMRTIEPDMDKFSAQQALDAHDAYYKDELKYFINVITKQAIERHLVAPLPKILSPMVMARYDDQQVRFVAAESAAAVQLRQYLDGKKKMLKDGQDAFREAMGEQVCWNDDF